MDRSRVEPIMNPSYHVSYTPKHRARATGPQGEEGVGGGQGRAGMDRGIGPGRAAMSAVGRGIKGMIERSGRGQTQTIARRLRWVVDGDGEVGVGRVRMVVMVMGPAVSAATSCRLQEWMRWIDCKLWSVVTEPLSVLRRRSWRVVGGWWG